MQSKWLVLSFLFVFLLNFVMFLHAECPNGCSGNGVCGNRDACDCYKNYKGNDCSERICPFHLAHVDTPKGDLNMDSSLVSTTVAIGSDMYPQGTYETYNPTAATGEAHFYMECANNGICSRKTGECECFDGYEGHACQRQSCPNKCNGHGVCMSISEFATKAGGTLVGKGALSATTYNLWDEKSIYGCACDPNYGGPDCSERLCKLGVDPLYDDNQYVTYETFIVRATMHNGQTLANSWIKLRVFDYWGESYITKKISILDDSATDYSSSFESAIKSLPNNAFPDINCEKPGTNAMLFTHNVKATDHLGIVMACQFISNPGVLRLPEIADSFIGIANNIPGTTTVAEVTGTSLRGEDYDWASTISNQKATVTNGGVVITLAAADTLLGTVPKLIKLGPQYLLVIADGGTTTPGLAYPWKHAAITTAQYFYVSSATVTALVPTITSLAIGQKEIIVSAAVLDSTLKRGDYIFYQNQIFRITSKSSDNLKLYIDRPFYGTAAAGTSVSAATDIIYVIQTALTTVTDTYTYVAECSGKGLCDRSTGICECFKGYTNDNCDTQNILAL